MSPGRLADVFASLRRNGALGRVEVGFLLATMVEWAGWLALVVYAFSRGGAAEAGFIGFAVGLPAILVAPTAAILGDRHPRSRVMFTAYVSQAVAFAAAGAAFMLGEALAGYALGVVAMALIALDSAVARIPASRDRPLARGAHGGQCRVTDWGRGSERSAGPCWPGSCSRWRARRSCSSPVEA